jgi:hypothetical protein
MTTPAYNYSFIQKLFADLQTYCTYKDEDEDEITKIQKIQNRYAHPIEVNRYIDVMCKTRGPILELIEFDDAGQEYIIKSVRLSTNIDKAMQQQRKVYAKYTKCVEV